LYYGYFTKCLFGNIINNNYHNICNIIPGINEVPDSLFYYANKPELGIELYSKLRERYSVDCLLTIRDKLKISNFEVIESIFPLTDRSYDNYEIYEFIGEELDIECSPNIVMSKINGFDLASDPNFLLTDGLIFEMIYTNACLIKFNGHVFRDNNLGNIMIEKYPYPRIYKIGSLYYMFTDGYRLVIIDAQVIALAETTQDLLGNTISRIPSKMLSHIKMIIETNTIDIVMSRIIPLIFKGYIITEDYTKEVLAAYPNIKIWSY